MKLIERWIVDDFYYPTPKPDAEIVWMIGPKVGNGIVWNTWDHRVLLCIPGYDIQIRHRTFWPLSFLLAFVIGFVGCYILGRMGVM